MLESETVKEENQVEKFKYYQKKKSFKKIFPSSFVTNCDLGMNSTDPSADAKGQGRVPHTKSTIQKGSSEQDCAMH